MILTFQDYHKRCLNKDFDFVCLGPAILILCYFWRVVYYTFVQLREEENMRLVFCLFIFLYLLFLCLLQGFPTWGTCPPGGTQEVSKQCSLGYICTSGGTQLMLRGTQIQKGWEPLVYCILIIFVLTLNSRRVQVLKLRLLSNVSALHFSSLLKFLMIGSCLTTIVSWLNFTSLN